MYSFTICSANKYTAGLKYEVELRNKHVANGISSCQIRRFKHEDYLRMFKGAMSNVVTRRIGSKHNQVR